MRPKRHTEKLAFCLSPQIAALLDQLVEERGQTKSEVIRQLIVESADRTETRRVETAVPA